MSQQHAYGKGVTRVLLSLCWALVVPTSNAGSGSSEVAEGARKSAGLLTAARLMREATVVRCCI